MIAVMPISSSKNIMKFVFYILLIGISFFSSPIPAQQLASLQERTPEQEATFQTEKLQQELQLSNEQARQVHEINLKYARARQQSNTRADAIQRIRDKEADLNRILTENQRTTLQNKRYERSQFQQNVQRQTNIPQDNQSRTQRTEPNRLPNTQQGTTEYRRSSPATPGAQQPAVNTQPRTTAPRVTAPERRIPERTVPESSNRSSNNEPSRSQNRPTTTSGSSGGRR